MTGAEHYAEAERLLSTSPSSHISDRDIARAQAHATLALAAATEKATAYAHDMDAAGYGR